MADGVTDLMNADKKPLRKKTAVIVKHRDFTAGSSDHSMYPVVPEASDENRRRAKKQQTDNCDLR